MSRRAFVIALVLLVTGLLHTVRFHRADLSDADYLIAQPLEYSDEPLSAYDRQLRLVADSLGWDWRLLAAVVYHESRFHNEASSSKGAVGLMQIRSARYSADSLLDPMTNISVGARYLRKLEKMFPAASPVDAMKFALAGYNLGEGKVGRLIQMADEAGLDATRWDNVAQMLPPGHHTVKYVENVLDTYTRYSREYAQ